MVATPWGKSEQLRNRRLRPGPGVPREEVVANQRERLFGAMVVSISERGYEATRVSDLVRISGVSSRTFYALFPDKRRCFLATLEAVLRATVAFATQRAGEGRGAQSAAGVAMPEEPASNSDNWAERSRRGFDSFLEMVAKQPAAARLVLIDAYAAGPEAVAPLEQAVAGFEWLTRRMLEQSPEPTELTAEMVSAHLGAHQEIARMRLLQGREAELPELADQLWDLMMSYRPPPWPLRTAPQPPQPQPPEEAGQAPPERAIRAFTAVVAEEGLAKTTIDAVLKQAQMSATTFYLHFENKEELMLAAIDSAGAEIAGAILSAWDRSPDWPQGIRAGLETLCCFLASRPAMATLMMAEVYAGGPAAMRRRLEALAPLRTLVAVGYENAPDTPAIAADAIAGAIFTLAYRRIRDSGPESLPTLAPLYTYLALSPFVGTEDACRVARGEAIGFDARIG